MAEKIRYTRKDLKGPDEFISSLSRVVEWTKENRSLVLGAVGAVALVVLVVFGTRAYYRWEEQKAATDLWPHLNRAQEILQSPASADPEKLARLEQFLAAHASVHPKAKAAVFARYYLGSIAFARGNYDLAVMNFQTAIDSGKGTDLMAFLLQQGLAQSLEARGDLVTAVAAYKKASAAATGELRDEAKMGEARVLFLMGKKQEAVVLYKSILTDNPETPLKGLVELRLAQLW